MAKCNAHPYFERIDEAEGFKENDVATVAMTNTTEESKKVSRNNGKKFVAVYRRITEEEFEARRDRTLLTLFE